MASESRVSQPNFDDFDYSGDEEITVHGEDAPSLDSVSGGQDEPHQSTMHPGTAKLRHTLHATPHVPWSEPVASQPASREQNLVERLESIVFADPAFGAPVRPSRLVDGSLHFLEQTQTLSRFKAHISAGREEIRQANWDAQRTGDAFVACGQSMMRVRRLRDDIKSAIDCVHALQHAVEMAAAAQEELRKRRLLSAVKILGPIIQDKDQLGATPMGRRLASVCHGLLNKARTLVFQELDAWLDKTRNGCQAFGGMILVRMSHRVDDESRAIARAQQAFLRSVRPSFANSIDHATASAVGADPAPRQLGDILGEFGLFETMGLDFARLYDCLDCAAALGEADKFKRRYQASRTEQLLDVASMMHNPATPAPSRTRLEVYPSFVATLTGLLVTEVTLLNFEGGLRVWEPEQFREAAENALRRATIRLAEPLKRFSAEHLLAFKRLVYLFARTLDESGLDSAPVLRSIANVRSHAEELLVGRCVSHIDRIFAADKYEPLTVTSSKRYRYLVAAYGLQPDEAPRENDSLHQSVGRALDAKVPPSTPTRQDALGGTAGGGAFIRSSSPTQQTASTWTGDGGDQNDMAADVTVPFSLLVPRLCAALGDFVSEYFEFGRGLGIAHMHRHVFRAVDRLLIEVNRRLKEQGRGKDAKKLLRISQVMQVSINAQHLIRALPWLHAFNSSFDPSRAEKIKQQLVEQRAKLETARARGGTVAVSRVPKPLGRGFTARGLLTQTHTLCTDLFFALINEKIDELLTLTSNIDWKPARANTSAHSYIADLVSYLETTFQSIEFMPLGIRQTVHFTSCSHVADYFMALLTRVRKINIIAVYNFDLDLCVLESFAQQQRLPGLVGTFRAVRELVDLFLTSAVSSVLDRKLRLSEEGGRVVCFEGLDRRLAVARLIKILSNYRSVGMMTRLPPGVPNVRRRDISAVVKRLKAELRTFESHRVA